MLLCNVKKDHYPYIQYGAQPLLGLRGAMVVSAPQGASLGELQTHTAADTAIYPRLRLLCIFANFSFILFSLCSLTLTLHIALIMICLLGALMSSSLCDPD